MIVISLVIRSRVSATTVWSEVYQACRRPARPEPPAAGEANSSRGEHAPLQQPEGLPLQRVVVADLRLPVVSFAASSSAAPGCAAGVRVHSVGRAGIAQ